MLKVNLVMFAIMALGSQLGDSYLLESVDLKDEEKQASLISVTHSMPFDVQKKVLPAKELKNHRMFENDSYQEFTKNKIIEESLAERFQGYLSSADFLSVPELTKSQRSIQYMPIYPSNTIDNKEQASENKWSVAFDQQPEEAINNLGSSSIAANLNQSTNEVQRVSFDDDGIRFDAVSGGHWIRSEPKMLTRSLAEAQRALQESLQVQDKLATMLNHAKSLKKTMVSSNNSIERRESSDVDSLINEAKTSSYAHHNLPPTTLRMKKPIQNGAPNTIQQNTLKKNVFVAPQLSIPLKLSQHAPYSTTSLSPKPVARHETVNNPAAGRRLMKLGVDGGRELADGVEELELEQEPAEHKWQNYYRHQQPIRDLDYSIQAARNNKFSKSSRSSQPDEYGHFREQTDGTFGGAGSKVGRLRGSHLPPLLTLEEGSSDSDSDSEDYGDYEDLMNAQLTAAAGVDSTSGGGWRKAGASKLLISRHHSGLEPFPAGVVYERGSLKVARGRPATNSRAHLLGVVGAQGGNMVYDAAEYEQQPPRQQSAGSTRDSLDRWSDYERGYGDDLAVETANPAHQQVVHVISSGGLEPSAADKIRGHGKYLWPIVGGGLTILVSFLIISNVLLSIPLLAMGASSLFKGEQQGAFQSQQLVPVYNLSQLISGGGGGGGGGGGSNGSRASSSSILSAGARSRRSVEQQLESRLERLIDQLVAGAGSAATLPDPRLLMPARRGALSKLGQVLKAAYCQQSKIKRQPLVFI